MDNQNPNNGSIWNIPSAHQAAGAQSAQNRPNYQSQVGQQGQQSQSGQPGNPGNGVGNGAGNMFNNLPSANTVKAESRGFFRALFDLSFSSYITVQFAKVIYVINIIIVALIYLAFILMSFVAVTQARGSEETSMALFMVLGVILFGWIPAVLHLIVVRLGLEGAIALIRIAQNTSALREKAIGR